MNCAAHRCQRPAEAEPIALPFCREHWDAAPRLLRKHITETNNMPSMAKKRAKLVRQAVSELYEAEAKVRQRTLFGERRKQNC